VPSLPDMTQKKLVLPKDLSNEAKMKLIKENQKMIQQKSNEYGLWCEALYKLSLANHVSKNNYKNGNLVKIIII
ncbi:hypothetical protein ACS22W_25645, partial [Escherichia coli]|uniref:hypothetical protein n=1 Tax=Escherichia coli TaxID=562 RepID=UPI003F270F23